MHPTNQKQDIMKNLIMIPPAAAMLIIAIFGLKEKNTLLEFIGIPIIIIGVIISITFQWIEVIKEKKLPSEFRERDEREKQVTAQATRKTYIITQNLLYWAGFLFLLVLNYINVSGWALAFVFYGLFLFNNILFLIFTRKKYDPAPLNPYPPNELKK